MRSADSYDTCSVQRARDLASGSAQCAIVTMSPERDSTLEIAASPTRKARVARACARCLLTEEAIVWDRATETREVYDARVTAAVAR